MRQFEPMSTSLSTEALLDEKFQARRRDTGKPRNNDALDALSRFADPPPMIDGR
jgi:hypothetical protein